MPERYASPARLPQVWFGADSGAKLGRSLVWRRPCTRTPRFARGAELGRVSPVGESAYPRIPVI